MVHRICKLALQIAKTGIPKAYALKCKDGNIYMITICIKSTRCTIVTHEPHKSNRYKVLLYEREQSLSIQLVIGP